jgi:hypothetical protein
MKSIRFGSRSAGHAAIAALISLALIAGTLAVFAASAPRVLAASRVIDVTLPIGRLISGTILKRTSATTTAPAAHVEVRACLDDTTNCVRHGVYTAADGTYTIKRLVPGKYMLQLFTEQIVDLQSGWYTTANTVHFNSAPAGASLVDVTPGNQTGINATIPVGFRMSGVIRIGLGTVGANVLVAACSDALRVCRYTWTVDEGAYTVDGLAPGQYTIHVMNTPFFEGYYRAGVPGNFTADAALATKVTVVSTNVAGKNFVVPDPSSGSYRITGFVKTTGNVAINGAHVTAGGAAGTAQATTSATGAFTVEGLRAGTYQVGIGRPYGNPSLGQVFFKSGVTGQYTWDPAAASSVVITTASKALGTIWEPVGRTMTGTVTHGGAPVFGSSVEVIPTGSGSWLAGGGFATTAADGTWRVQGLRPATYRIRATEQYYPPSNAVPGYYKLGATGNYTRNLEQGTVVDVTAANKTTSPLALPLGNTITGTIRDAGGGGVAYVAISVESIGNTEVSYRYTSTSSTGSYSVAGIPDGRFTIRVSAPADQNFQVGYYRDAPPANFISLPGKATPVILGDGVAPTVTARTPASGATGVSRLANVTATFSEPVMNATTTTLYLRRNGTTTMIAAVVTYDAILRRATLNPKVTLSANTSYKAVIRDIYDASGNQVGATSWTFTTGP